MNFGTLVTAMVTPFKENGQVNYTKAQELAAYLVETGSDSLVITGTTGETSTLTRAEKISLYGAVKEAVGKEIKIIAGTGDNETDTSISLTKEAVGNGADAILLVVPYYNRPPQEGLYQHFKVVAEATELPVMLYNIPSRTGTNMLPETVERLAAIKNIVAIKEAAGSMDQVSELRQRLPENFAIYSGDDPLTLPMLALGADGVVSVAGHLMGRQIKEMIRKFKANDTAGALAIHLSLLKFFKTMFIVTNPIPVKTAMNLLGWELGGFRLPMVGATAHETEIIRGVLQEYGLTGRNN